MNFYISDFMIYVIATISIILVLIDLLKLEKKRDLEEKSKNV